MDLHVALWSCVCQCVYTFVSFVICSWRRCLYLSEQMDGRVIVSQLVSPGSTLYSAVPRSARTSHRLNPITVRLGTRTPCSRAPACLSPKTLEGRGGYSCMPWSGLRPWLGPVWPYPRNRITKQEGNTQQRDIAARNDAKCGETEGRNRLGLAGRRHRKG